MTMKPCPHCGRPVLAIGVESCDACLARTVVASAAPPKALVRWSSLRDPRPCRECHREFLPRTGSQKRCPDCCRDGIGGYAYRDGRRVNKRELRELWEART